MIVRYFVSREPRGPWMELKVCEEPDEALHHVRANFDWPVYWIAQMRPITSRDLLNEPEVFWADVKERVAVLFGGVVVENVAPLLTRDLWEKLAGVIETALARAEPVWTPAAICAYEAGDVVGPDDFVRVARHVRGVKPDPAGKRKVKLDL